LNRRHGFDLEKSSLLWLEHIISSLVGTSNENRVLVNYDDLLQSPTAELERIAKGLHQKIDPQELQKFELEFLDTSLRHTIYQFEDLRDEKSILPLVQEVYSTLLNAIVNNDLLSDERIKTKIKQWENEFYRLSPILSFIDKLNSQIETISTERDLQVQALTAQVQVLTTQVQASTAQEQALTAQVQVLTTQLNEILKSKAWKLVTIFRRIRMMLIPDVVNNNH
jgi:hypothetical protein